MGSKNRNKKNKKLALKSKIKDEYLPFISLCTPTFNRRPFINQCIKNIMNQTYPIERMEWIIIDDGTDKVGDLFQDISFAKYISLDERVALGKKRNMLHNEAKGDIIIYIDDDDFYPKERVKHAVTELLKSDKLIAGTSEIYVSYNGKGIYKFGPYGNNHATAGTFAFKRELLNNTSYKDDSCFAEEKHFLNNYTIPLLQLNPFKTILVFKHAHNTIDKEQFIKDGDSKYVTKTDYKHDKFFMNEQEVLFYDTQIHNDLSQYDHGLPKHKPDVLQKLKEIRESNENDNQKSNENDNPNGQMFMTDDTGRRQITNRDLIQYYNKQKEALIEYKSTIDILTKKLEQQGKIIESLKNKIE